MNINCILLPLLPCWNPCRGVENSYTLYYTRLASLWSTYMKTTKYAIRKYREVLTTLILRSYSNPLSFKAISGSTNQVKLGLPLDLPPSFSIPSNHPVSNLQTSDILQHTIHQ